MKFYVLRERSSASFVEHSVYIIFKMHNVLFLVVLLWFATIYGSSIWNTYLIWKFWVLRERSIDNFLFVEQPINSIFNAQSSLTLDCWFYFVTSYPNSMCKTFLFWSSTCSAKEATILIGHPEKWLKFYYLILICHSLREFHT